MPHLLLLATAFGGVNGSILAPNHGDLLELTDPSYDVVEESMSAAVTMGGGGANVHINGHLFAPGGPFLLDRVAMGYDVPWWATTPGWPSWIYQRSRYSEVDELLLPVMAESFDANGDVIGRDRVLVFDGRADDLLAWTYSDDLFEDTVGARLTPSGLVVFSRTHSAMMPLIGLGAFNDRLDAMADAHVAIGSEVDACFPLTDELGFKATDAYKAVAQEARSAKTTYDLTRLAADAARNAGNLVAAATLDAVADKMCVQDPVADDHFEVCVYRLEADPVGMTAGRFGYATLDGDHPTADLSSDFTFEDVDVLVDLRLRDVELRWSEGAQHCVNRPTEAVAEGDYTTDPFLAGWSTCEDQLLTAVTAQTGEPNLFDLIVNPLDEERLEVVQLSDAWTFLAGVSTDTSEACAEPFLRDESRDALFGLQASVGNLVGDAWNEGYPVTEQAEALTMLFSGFDIGTYPQTTTIPDAPYRSVNRSIDRGFGLRWDTATEPFFQAATVFPQGRWMTDVTYGSPTTQPGLTPNGRPYDLSIRLTANALNQHLQAAVLERGFTSPLDASWDDFGVRPPAGVSGSAPMPLTGRNLGRWAPPLAALGPNVELYLSSTMAPTVWIPQDGYGHPIGEQPILLSLGQALLTMVVPDPGGDPALDRVVFQAAIDIYDRDLRLTFDVGAQTSTFLRARFGDPTSSVTILANSLAACPMHLHLANPPFIYQCEAQLERVILEDLVPLVERRLLGLFGSFGVPRYFDAQGASPDPAVVLSDVQTWTSNGELTVYLDLD